MAAVAVWFMLRSSIGSVINFLSTLAEAGGLGLRKRPVSTFLS